MELVDYDKLLKFGGKVSLRYGLYTSIITAIGFPFVIFLLADDMLGLFPILLITADKIYISIILLYLVFPFAVYYFGKKYTDNLLMKKNKFFSSLEFSFNVNSVIWTVFLISRIMLTEMKYSTMSWIKYTIIAFLFCSIITSLTIGKYIGKKIQVKINESLKS